MQFIARGMACLRVSSTLINPSFWVRSVRSVLHTHFHFDRFLVFESKRSRGKVLATPSSGLSHITYYMCFLFKRNLNQKRVAIYACAMCIRLTTHELYISPFDHPPRTRISTLSRPLVFYLERTLSAGRPYLGFLASANLFEQTFPLQCSGFIDCGGRRENRSVRR